MHRYILSILLLIFPGILLHPQSATVTDIDGHIYSTILLGEQRWMAENLKVSRYRNNQLIEFSEDQTSWRNAHTGLWAAYQNDPENIETYGKLYNWHAVNDPAGLCPSGWRIPSDEDWQILLHALDTLAHGNNNLVGRQLKSRRATQTPLGAPWETDEHPRWEGAAKNHGYDFFGFSVMPAGSRNSRGEFHHLGEYAYFWTSTQNTSGAAFSRVFLNTHKGMSRSVYRKNNGFSVRCIEGEPVFIPDNVLTVGSVAGQPGEDLYVEVYLENNSLITSFEMELDIPAGFEFVPGSISASNRITDHVLTSSFPDENTLKITGNSPTQQPLLHDSGPIFGFYLLSPFQEGTWPIELGEVILMDIASQNVLTNQQDGTINLLQGDREFWMAVPVVTKGHGWGGRAFYFRLANSNKPNTVTLSMPANPAFTPISLALEPNEVTSIDITSQIENFWIEFPDVIYNNGVLIESSQPTTAYYEKGTHINPDIYSLKGRSSLGRDFYVPFQTHYASHPAYDPLPYSALYIVATENNTRVTITPSRAAHPSRPAQVPFTVVLQRGQTYAVAPDDYQGQGLEPKNRLAGTRVQSDKPIAITVSDDSIGPSCRDVVGDQLVPVSSVGSEYVMMKGRLGIPEYFYMVATDNQHPTEIFVDGTLIETLEAGQQSSYEFTAANHYLSSSSPIYVFHVGGFGCEMGGAIIPPASRNTGSNRVAFTRSKAESFFLNILVETGAENSFSLIAGNDGTPITLSSSSFTTVAGKEDWLVGEFDLSAAIPVGEPSVLSNSDGVFHLGIINGGSSSGAMYGYFSTFRTFGIMDKE